MSASCSIAPDSLRSESIGLLVPPLVSTALESWDKAITGIFNSFANALRFLEIVDISCSLLPALFEDPRFIN